MDNSKAKFDLAWSPRHDAETLIEAAWAYEQVPNDPRKVFYPG
jgi:hypothetical protein